MSKTLRLDLTYLAKTYGIELEDARVILNEDGTFSLDITDDSPELLAADIAADLAAIKAIGSEPDAQRVSAEREGERSEHGKVTYDPVTRLMVEEASA